MDKAELANHLKSNETDTSEKSETETCSTEQEPDTEALQDSYQKIDVRETNNNIEGFEDKVLITFLKKCKKTLIPKNIILEHSLNKEWEIDLIKFLLKFGYKEIFKNKSNIILIFQR